MEEFYIAVLFIVMFLCLVVLAVLYFLGKSIKQYFPFDGFQTAQEEVVQDNSTESSKRIFWLSGQPSMEYEEPPPPYSRLPTSTVLSIDSKTDPADKDNVVIYVMSNSDFAALQKSIYAHHL